MSLEPFACFRCRRSFRRPGVDSRMRPCPVCGETARQLPRRFKTPPRDHVEAWQKLEQTSQTLLVRPFEASESARRTAVRKTRERT